MIEGFLEWQSFSICKSAADNSTTYLAIVLTSLFANELILPQIPCFAALKFTGRKGTAF